MNYVPVVIGILFVITGVLVLRSKQYGPSQGMRMLQPYFCGKAAVAIGIFNLVFGLVILIASLYLPLTRSRASSQLSNIGGYQKTLESNLPAGCTLSVEGNSIFIKSKKEYVFNKNFRASPVKDTSECLQSGNCFRSQYEMKILFLEKLNEADYSDLRAQLRRFEARHITPNKKTGVPIEEYKPFVESLDPKFKQGVNIPRWDEFALPEYYIDNHSVYMYIKAGGWVDMAARDIHYALRDYLDENFHQYTVSVPLGA